MARRGGAAGAGKKPARGKRGKDAELEVEEAPEAPGAPAARDGFETSLLVGAFVALLLAFIMIQMKLSSDYGAGLFG